jgi:hypothetical protein
MRVRSSRSTVRADRVSFTVVYDADVLHRAPVRDLVVRLALVRRLNLRARWTEQILDEMVESIARRRPELRERLGRTRRLMCDAVPAVSSRVGSRWSLRFR